MLSLMSLSKSKIFTRVALVSLVLHLCGTRVVRVEVVSRVAFMFHFCRTRVVRVARVWRSCCKIDYIKS